MFECVAQLDDKRFNMPSPIITIESVRLCECVYGSVCVCVRKVFQSKLIIYAIHRVKGYYNFVPFFKANMISENLVRIG